VTRRILPALALLVLAACGGGSPSAPTVPVPTPAAQDLRSDGVAVSYTAADAAWAPRVHADGVAGRANALAFFGSDLASDLRITLYPDRAAIDAHWRVAFRDPAFRSECWMIASGDQAGVVLLSPGAWARESCGHDAEDAPHRSGVVAHEVVHVHHGQHNPSLGTTAGTMPWFVEGLAVHASGQLDAVARAQVRETLASGGGPQRLADVLPAGYSFAGSLVAWIDRRAGRATLLDLLDDTEPRTALDRLGTNEPELLAAWRADVIAGR
jgi:hypothetical protein